MSDWPDVQLNDLCELIVDSEHKTAPKSAEGTHPLVRTTDLGEARVNYSQAQRVDDATYEMWTRRAAPATGDLILAREAPVGGIGRVPDGVLPVLGQRTVLLRPDPSRCDSFFLLYTLAAPDAQERMNAMATGATVPHLNMSDIRALSVPVPPDLSVQRRIGVALAAFDELIEINERRIALLEDLARSLYREWFVRFRFPGHEQVDLIDSELGMAPEGWQTRDLGSAARWFSGGTPSTKNVAYWGGDIPWITSGSLRSMLLDTSERRLTTAGVAAGSRLVDRDTLLFVVRGMSLVREFRVGLADRPLAFGQDCKALVANDGIDPLFLAFTVFDRQQDIQGMVELAGHGTGKLSTDRVKAVTFSMPPASLQAAFASMIRPKRELMSTLTAETRKLIATRDLLLPRLVTGLVDISELDLGASLPSEVA